MCRGRQKEYLTFFLGAQQSFVHNYKYVSPLSHDVSVFLKTDSNEHFLVKIKEITRSGLIYISHVFIILLETCSAVN